MSQLQHLSTAISSYFSSWNRQRTDGELASFIDRKLANLVDIDLELK